MKLAGVVILYNPQPDVVKNILSYSKYLDKTYIIDNTENPPVDLVLQLKSIAGAIYIAHLENGGIATRLNEAAEKAIAQGYTHLLTMDQDSLFPEGMFTSYLQKTKEHFQYNADIGIFAVNYQPQQMIPSDSQEQVISTIISGSIVNLDAYTKAGGYDNDLFLDLVDADFSYRINRSGYKIILFRDIVLTHAIGYIVWGRSLKNFRLTPRGIHAPVRMYYLVRNSLYLIYKKKVSPDEKKDIKKCFVLIKNNLLYNKRGSVLRYMLKGYKDYKKGKMGKISL